MRLTILLAAVLLVGCATTPEPRIVVREVKVAVPVPCLDPADVKPRPVKPVAKLPADTVAALAVAVSHLLDWSIWGETASGQLAACAKVPAVPENKPPT